MSRTKVKKLTAEQEALIPIADGFSIYSLSLFSVGRFSEISNQQLAISN